MKYFLSFLSGIILPLLALLQLMAVEGNMNLSDLNITIAAMISLFIILPIKIFLKDEYNVLLAVIAMLINVSILRLL